MFILKGCYIHCESKKNSIHLTFDRNVGKCRPICKILSLSKVKCIIFFTHTVRHCYMTAPSTPATMSKQHSTCFAKNGNNVKRVYRKISSLRQSRNKLNMFNLFRLCRKNRVAFDNVASTLLMVWTGLKGNSTL